MDQFLSCDWGTSSFRLWLVRTENAEILATKKSSKGIAATFNSLGEREKNNPEERLLFYLRIIGEAIDEIQQEQGISLAGVPLVISGMASSSIGMAELPYNSLPFGVDGKNIETACFEANAAFAHPVLLISGVKSNDDVMRGEETQLVGIIADSGAADVNGIYIFPGTHSKHIKVKDGQVTGFKTYMTGEIFDLLCRESILKGGIKKNEDLHHPNCLQRFKEGVRDAIDTNLLHQAFRVRTNDLFGKLSKKENFHYLSGLLLGAELESLSSAADLPVYVCSESHLQFRYETALDVLGIKNNAHVFPAGWAEEAVVRGQLKIYSHFNRNV
ncbi:2-dehydro-3-deoxygalactonokinase [Pontibacter sp. 172403-2]|uniref:2-dehydro-3-deoxygalactonokinase n=1 Tax=Pontibacter rufus TaxID=2791028 RepID=UPI0018AFDB24|nr:2-dehydro-3-deoxygalactonokinase [Pontibacter sp. 172403-2]MBF9254735.1 2-dehydro-3-deoxygalactonokinase [Pontibacter sp. 172403-2]